MSSLTIVVPVYNEENRIIDCIHKINIHKFPNSLSLSKVIFVNDGSTDKTSDVINSQKMRYPTSLISYEKNQGRGFALKKAMHKIQTDYAIFIDVDMMVPLETLDKWADIIKTQKPDIIIASRKMKESKEIGSRGIIRKFLGLAHSKLANAILGINYFDHQAGFKLFNKDVANYIFPRITIKRWGADSEMLFIAKLKKYKVSELPVTWRHEKQHTKVKIIRDVLRNIIELTSIRYNNALKRYE